MARKDGKSADRVGPHHAGSPEAVAWLTERGQMRDALKQAKLCYRAGETTENRDLLERTYLLRVRELIQQAMPQAAAEVARDLLELGVSTDQRRAELATDLTQVGLTAEAARLTAKITSPELLAGVTLQRIDLAVARKNGASDADPEIREKAERVRRAIDLLAGNEEAAALELLQDFSRQSPWADWRLFVRGLAAHYRGDAATRGANWDRLDAQRRPARLASALLRVAQLSQAPVLAAANPTAEATRTSSTTKARAASQGPKKTESLVQAKQLDEAFLAQVERAAFGEPVSERIDRLRRVLLEASENPRESSKAVLSAVESLRAALSRLDSRWPIRLTDIVQGRILEFAGRLTEAYAWQFLQDFSRVAEPLEIDPHWKRLAAHFVEGGDPERGAKYWLEYSQSLENSTSMTPQRRAIAQAVARVSEANCLHRQMLAHADELDYNAELESLDSKTWRTVRGRMIDALRAATQLAPYLRPVYFKANEISEVWDEEELGLEFEERLVDHFPEEVDALASLTNRYIDHGNWGRAAELFERLRAARPLDAYTAQVGMKLHILRTRAELSANRLDLAAQWLDQAQAYSPQGANDYRLLVLRAVLALKSTPPKNTASKTRKKKSAKAEAGGATTASLLVGEGGVGLPAVGPAAAGAPVGGAPAGGELSPVAASEHWVQLAGRQVGDAAALLRMRLEAGYCGIPTKTAAKFLTEYRKALRGPKSSAKTAAVAQVMTLALLYGKEFEGYKTIADATHKYLATLPYEDCEEEHATRYCAYLVESRLMKRKHANLAFYWEELFPENPVVLLTCALAHFLVPNSYSSEYQTRQWLGKAQELLASNSEFAYLSPRIDYLRKTLDASQSGLGRFFDSLDGPESDDDGWSDEFDDEWTPPAPGGRRGGAPRAASGNLIDLIKQMVRPEDIPAEIRKALGIAIDEE